MANEDVRLRPYGLRRDKQVFSSRGDSRSSLKRRSLFFTSSPNPKRTSDGEKKQTFKNGYVTYTVRNGKMNGPYREYDTQGQQILEIPMRDNQSHGIGWQRRDGQIHKIEFVRNLNRNFLTRKLNFSSKIRY